MLASILIAAIACGGDAGTGPSHSPSGSATRVPRVLAMSAANGRTPPTAIYKTVDGTGVVSADSGSATLQDDSMLVVRTFHTRSLPAGAPNFVRFSVTGAGVLDASGTAVFYYLDAPPDTAHVLPDGSVIVAMKIVDMGEVLPFGTFTFAKAYTGQALNPMPRLTGVSPSNAVQYGSDMSLTISGSSFVPGTTVRWNGTFLTVTSESPSRITATVPGVFFTAPDTAQLMVTNPPPGGGDRILRYVVAPATAYLSSIAPSGMPAGGGDFTLHVHGGGFPPGATVLWNGTPLLTGYLGPSDLSVIVPGANIASAGTVQISVRTQASGGTTLALPFAITGAAATKLAEVSIPFVASALVADPVRPLVYAAADLGETTHAHSVVAIDPAAGTIVWSISAPKDVHGLAVSDDGQYLYFGERSDPTVTRVALATHTVDMTFKLPDAQTQAYTLAVSPGHPHTLAVLRSCDCSPIGGYGSDLAIYDDSIPRPHTLTGSTVPVDFAFADPTTIDGVDGGAGMYTYAIDASGVTGGTHVFVGRDGRYTFANGRIYAAGGGGGIYDMTTQRSTLLTSLLVTAVFPSSDGTLLYTVGGPGSYVRAYDVARDAETAAVPVSTSTYSGSAGPILRWGADGLVFARPDAVYFVRADFVH